MKRRRLLVAGLAAVTLAVLWVLVFRPFSRPPFDFIDPGAKRFKHISLYSGLLPETELIDEYYMFRGLPAVVLQKARQELSNAGYGEQSAWLGGTVFENANKSSVTVGTSETVSIPDELKGAFVDLGTGTWVVVRIRRSELKPLERGELWLRRFLR